MIFVEVPTAVESFRYVSGRRMTVFFCGNRWEQEQTEEPENEYTIRGFSTCTQAECD